MNANLKAMAATACLFLGALPAHAQLKVAPGGKLWLEGQSTLHPYKSSATRLDAKLSTGDVTLATADDVRKAVESGTVKSMTVSVAVANLKSGENGLDDNLAKALKAARWPTLTFTMQRYRVLPAPTTASVLALEIDGKLSVAGMEKPVTLRGDAKLTAAGLRITGMTGIQMTDFGVTPPVLMMGMLKTANHVDVRFDVELLAGAASLSNSAAEASAK